MYYEGVQSENGKIVDESEAYEYALKRSLNGSDEDKEQFKNALVEWFYSGDWIRREDDELFAERN